MSKLESLLGMVDSINVKSDTLVRSLAESNTLISSIVQLNSSIAAYDVEIDAMTQLIHQNNAYLSEFQKLYEKTFYLESNLAYNDSYTNKTSYHNLYNEFDFLWNEFDAANSLTRKDSQASSPTSPLAPPTKGLKTMLSISNLNLKPIRCKDAKVSRQKSKYRLSGAYTLNPLKPPSSREISHSSANTDYSNIMELSDIDGSYSSKDTSMVSPSEHSSVGGAWQSPECLSASISDVHQSQTPDKTTSPHLFKSSQSRGVGSEVLGSSDTIDYHHTSPSSSLSDVDNFHQFLLPKRVSLPDHYPNVIKKTTSHDSVFSSPQYDLQPNSHSKFHNPAEMINTSSKTLSTQPTVEAIYSTPFDAPSNFKEHSAKILATENATLLTETGSNSLTTPKRHNNYGIFHLLNSPLGSPRGFKQRRGSGTSINFSNSVQRRKSIDIISRSLASTFLTIVGNSSPKKEPTTTPCPGKIEANKTSPPLKIKSMRRNIKNPIEPNNDIRAKRLPPNERQSKVESASLLTVGSIKPKKVTQENSSSRSELSFSFQTPRARRFSQSLLRDTWNESLLF